ncbi:MAG: hypothetical protein AB7I50_14965 [Vicinamibacterales bacterium]
MRQVLMAAVAVFGLVGQVAAAPNVTNVTQKGSLLIFPDTGFNPVTHTLVRIQNDGSGDVDVKCFWLDDNKNRVDFQVAITANQAIWFDMETGNGTYQVNHAATSAANGFTPGNQNPFNNNPGYGPSNQALLACWAIDAGSQNQIKWNHLSGTATVWYTTGLGAYEYSAYAFFAPTGGDRDPIGAPGTLNLNGLAYDACPLYQIAQFTPARSTALPPPLNTMLPRVDSNGLALAGCTLDLRQDWTPAWTKLQFDVWNEDEVKFTGAYECADSVHATFFNQGTLSRTGGASFFDGLDAGAQNFAATTLATFGARYRVQGVKSSVCDRTKGPNDPVAAVTTEAVGLLGVQITFGTRTVATTLTGAGKMSGNISWDPEGVVPEGGLR